MAIEVMELYNSRRIQTEVDKSEATLEYYGRGSFNEADMLAAFLADAPPNFLGIPYRAAELKPIGGAHWNATISYSTSNVTTRQEGQGGSESGAAGTAPGPNDPLSSDYSWDISTFTEKITQSKQTVGKYQSIFADAGDVIPDTFRIIGLTQDGEVHGCDRVSPKMEFSITRTFGFVTLDYLNTIFEMTGKVNDESFYGFEAESVLFLGAQGKPKDITAVSVSFKFAVSPNETEIEITSELTGISKKGHEYLWVAYNDVISSTSLVKEPKYVYVERIYNKANFEQLMIGH